MNNNTEQKYNIQEQLIRGFGKEICHIVKYWKPIKQQRCVTCGKWVYHIIEHAMMEHKLD
jgi:hypothetical protein